MSKYRVNIREKIDDGKLYTEVIECGHKPTREEYIAKQEKDEAEYWDDTSFIDWLKSTELIEFVEVE